MWRHMSSGEFCHNNYGCFTVFRLWLTPLFFLYLFNLRHQYKWLSSYSGSFSSIPLVPLPFFPILNPSSIPVHASPLVPSTVTRAYVWSLPSSIHLASSSTTTFMIGSPPETNWLRESQLTPSFATRNWQLSICNTWSNFFNDCELIHQLLKLAGACWRWKYKSTVGSSIVL